MSIAILNRALQLEKSGPGWVFYYEGQEALAQTSDTFTLAPDGGSFMSNVEYRVIAQHPTLAPDGYLHRVVFSDQGQPTIVDAPVNLLTGKPIDESLVTALLNAFSPELLAMLAQMVVGAFTADQFEIICAGLASIGCNGGNQITYDAGDIWYYEPISVLAPNYDASLDTVNCDVCGGWVADKNNPDTPQRLRVFINGILAGTAIATIGGRDDVSTELVVTNTTGHVYGWTFTIPDAFKTGGPISVEIKPMSGTNAFRHSPKQSQYACLDQSTLINVAQNKAVTAPDANFGSFWTADHLTDGDADTAYTTPCYATNDPVTLLVDLGGTAQPQKVILVPNNQPDGPDWLPVDYQILGSLDGSTYFVLATVTGQARTTQEISIPIERDLAGNYRSIRYGKLVTSKNSSVGGACNYVRLNEIKFMAPSLTDGTGNPPTRQPKRIDILGDLGQNEGTSTGQKVWLYYSNGDSEDITSVASRSVGIDFSLTWASDGTLTAATNSTPNDTRSATLTASHLGLSYSKLIQIYDASVAVYVKSYRIDKREGPLHIPEGGVGTYRVVGTRSDDTEFQYVGSGSYTIDAPYPNGMTAATGAEAVGTVNLPANSITADLTGSSARTLRFNFPNGGGSITIALPLLNMPDAAIFDHYEIDGNPEIMEGGAVREFGINTVFTNGSKQAYTDAAGSFSLKGQYPNGVSLTALQNTRFSVGLQLDNITADVPGTLVFTFGNGAKIELSITFKNVSASQPPGTGTCANYAKATQTEYDGWEILNVYEFVVSTSVRRAFASKAEAIAGMQSLNSGSPSASLDRQRCSSSSAAVNSILYGNNQPPDNDFNKWPVEAGFWVVYYDATPSAKYIVETDACGKIKTKETYTP